MQEKIWVKYFTEEFDGKEGGYNSLSLSVNVGSKLWSDAEGHRDCKPMTIVLH